VELDWVGSPFQKVFRALSALGTLVDTFNKVITARNNQMGIKWRYNPEQVGSWQNYPSKVQYVNSNN
jgi:hypothetical protein